MFRPARRRVAWFPIALIVLAALAVVAFLRAASFLVDPARDSVKADAAFVLGGEGGERVLRACELHRGEARTRLRADGRRGDGGRGAAGLPLLAGGGARARGVPDGSIVLDTKSSNSEEEAAYGLMLAKARGWKRVLVVSDPPHLRRLDLVWGRALEGSVVEFVLVASRPRWLEPGRWWRNRKSAHFVFTEYIKLVYTLL